MITILPKKSAPKNPRISVNKLAEYLEADSTRRKKIVYDAKYGEAFITTRYVDVRDVAENFITKKVSKSDVEKKIIEYNEAASAAIANNIPKNDYQVQYNTGSAASLEALLNSDMSFLNRLEKLSCPANKLMRIKGVNVSVNPDLVLKQKVRGVINVGALKIHFSKTNQLPNESQKIVGVMLNSYVENHLVDKANGELLNSKLCLSFDVFKQHIESCPSSIATRVRRIEDACEEIALWWEKL